MDEVECDTATVCSNVLEDFHSKPEQRSLGGEDNRAEEELRVSGVELLKSLKDALQELDVPQRGRNEIVSLTRFLVAFYTDDEKQTLDLSQLSRLAFTIRIESVSKTRKCLFDMLQVNPKVMKVQKVDEGFLVPTDTLIAYLCTRKYKLPVETDETIDVEFTSCYHTQKSSIQAPQPHRQHRVKSNLLPFLVNMFARRVPGYLLYSNDSTDTGTNEGSDFFVCARFLRHSLLVQPVNVDKICEQIWRSFKRLSRMKDNLANANDLGLYCMPIVGSNWSSELQRRPGRSGDWIVHKAAFMTSCKDCLLAPFNARLTNAA